jgi:MinD-like ATPase involved in chromosome partitioning or flagellar assembly
MSLVAITSLHGAPGTTTFGLALAAAWHREVVLVEADADGGVLAARWGLATRPGLADLAARARRRLEPADVHELSQPVGAVRVIVAPSGADAAAAAVRALAGPLLDAVGRLAPHDVLVDAGRLRGESATSPLVEAADSVLVLIRPQLEQVASAAATPLPARARLVLVGERPHRADDVALALGVPVLAVVADDSRGAASPLRAGTPYGRSVRRAVQRMATLLDTSTQGACR